MAGKPSNTHHRGYSKYYVAWRGNTPLLYPPSPLISHPVPALTSVQNKVNWSLVEHGLQVTKHLKHPYLGNKGVMVWGCPLLGFYSRVRTRSYKDHFKGRADKLLNRNTFYSIHVFLVIRGHIVLDVQMTLKRKNYHSTEFKLVGNEILHKILGLFCQKVKIQDGRDDNHLGFDL